jgi:hypothetical protein
MFRRRNLVVFVVLVLAGFVLSSCGTKESKLSALRDELVQVKKDLADMHKPIFDRAEESVYKACLAEASLREESKNKCEEDRQQHIELIRIYDQKQQNRINEIRQKIQELEQNPDTNQNR